jgi:hypothetical protein
VRSEELSKLNKFSVPIGPGIRDLPVCSVVFYSLRCCEVNVGVLNSKVSEIIVYVLGKPETLIRELLISC